MTRSCAELLITFGAEPLGEQPDDLERWELGDYDASSSSKRKG